MNYYAFHIGDYAVHTRHLSLLEDLAYRRLMDLYYTRELPLTSDLEQLSRLVGMRENLAEVSSVVHEFFVTTDAGWVHTRCEKEITKATKAAEVARANGSKGGRPPMKNPKKTQRVSSGNPAETQRQAPNTQYPKPKTTTQDPSILASEFEAAWKAYPSRPGASKPDARKSWAARVAAGVSTESLMDGVLRYAEYCRLERTAPNYIKQPATFFGPGEHYLADWTATPVPVRGGANKQEALEQRNQAVGAAWLAKENHESV